MTQKKTKPEIPADMWLHVATDALWRYAAGGGQLLIGPAMEDASITVQLMGVTIDDPRLAPAFAKNVSAMLETVVDGEKRVFTDFPEATP